MSWTGFTIMLAILSLTSLVIPTSGSVSKNSIRGSKSLVKGIVKDLNGKGKEVQRNADKLLNTIDSQGRCRVNVCFALDGSAFVSERIYKLQKSMVLLASVIVGSDSDATFSAVQFADTTTAISPLQSGLNEFLSAVQSSTYEGEKNSNVAAGIGYCSYQVLGAQNGQKSIVILGAGKSTVGFTPETVSEQFLPPRRDGAIFAVSTARSSKSFLEIVGGDEDRIFSLRSLTQLPSALADLVSGLCGFEVDEGIPPEPSNNTEM